MPSFVDYNYKINIYLDTNILVDYVEHTYPLLNLSLDFLSNSPFVILRSSHYVEYEMTEVRKRRLFYFKVKGVYPPKNFKYSNMKQTWELDGKSYVDYKDAIKKTIISDFESLEVSLGVRFDDHVLHDKLIFPTRDMCLTTKLSREDSMVIISCMYPSPAEQLDYCILLTNDDQFVNESIKNSIDINSIFNKYGLNAPTLVSLKNLNNGKDVLNLELNSGKGKKEIEDFWSKYILFMIRQKNSHAYLGHSIKIGNSNIASELVFVDIEEPNKVLLDSDGLFIVLNDLSTMVEIDKDFDYWDNNSSVVLPHRNVSDTTYSFKPTGISEDTLKRIQQKGNLLFYRN